MNMHVPCQTTRSLVAMLAAVTWLLPVSPLTGFAQTRAQMEEARKSMVQKEIVGAGVTHPRVIQSMKTTPRHEFVALKYRKHAYLDMSLPIGQQQTISSPFIVALMTESLDPQPTDKVLEIGTGSGYQAAVLSPLVREVYTIEIVDSLGHKAERTLRRLHYDNISVKVGDGYQGWPEHAPFDKIIVTCSPEKVPQPLVQQLKEGGLMVIPVGERYQQTLYVLTKKEGVLEAKALRPTLFVPMTGVAESQRRVNPDPLHPTVVNGGFEEPADDNGLVPGWYYQRQMVWETDRKAPQDDHYLTFRNADAGRGSRALQGFPIDGREIGRLQLSAWVKTESVVPGNQPDMESMIAVSFYDQDRRELGVRWLGPWRGTDPWHQTTKSIRVPIGAREGILRIGLFGATGQISFDDVRMKAIPR